MVSPGPDTFKWQGDKILIREMYMKELNHSKIIESEHLFWGSPKLGGIITDDQRQILCDLELYDWLSCLYWGEGIAMNYALKMSEISPNKEKWRQVYADEHRHQTILSSWFIEHALTPLPKNKLITHAFNQVERINSSMSESKIVDTIYFTQVFFEELFHSLLRVRLPHIKDRDLQAIFYQIYSDEADHLGKARTEINELNQTPKKLYQILEENKSRLFPLDLAKQVIPEDLSNISKQLLEDIVGDMLSLAKKPEKPFAPIDIISKFQKIPGYNCIACSPKRHDGLHLEPKLDKNRNIIVDAYSFPKRCEGFNSVVHGGYIAMVLDEMMGYAPILKLNLLPMTKSMSINFKLPILVNKTYFLEAMILKEESQVITCKAFIKDSNDLIYAESEGKMFVPTKTQATKILGNLAHHEVTQGMFLS